MLYPLHYPHLLLCIVVNYQSYTDTLTVVWLRAAVAVCRAVDGGEKNASAFGVLRPHTPYGGLTT